MSGLPAMKPTNVRELRRNVTLWRGVKEWTPKERIEHQIDEILDYLERIE